MLVDKASRTKLRKRLPHRYAPGVKTLLAKEGRDVSTAFIRGHMTGAENDAQVWKALFRYADICQAQVKGVKRRVKALHNR